MCENTADYSSRRLAASFALLHCCFSLVVGSKHEACLQNVKISREVILKTVKSHHYERRTHGGTNEQWTACSTMMGEAETAKENGPHNVARQ
jgi:hypothetical protein